MSDATESTPPQPSKTPDVHPLDALTGGAFSAATSGERSARIREWLSTDPAAELLQEVFKELSGRDKGAARAIRERLDEIRRAHAQEAIAAEWADKARALLTLEKINIADALAWQRDAAKAGAPLSREPLSLLKVQLAERVKTIEDLQHRVQVQREVAVLLAQRIEVLSTKPWQDAQAVLEALGGDVQRWLEQEKELTNDVAWGSVEARFPTQLEASHTQLLLVWDAFQSALALAIAAAQDTQAPLPPVPVWADELRVARGLPSEAAQRAEAAAPSIDPALREQAQKLVHQALQKLEQETAQGHGKASNTAANALRAVLKQHGKLIDHDLEHKVNAALVAAGELQGWQRWSADQLREELVGRAQALLQRPAGQELGGRKMQELLRQLRDQWKQADHGAPANHVLWKKFDDACNAAYKVVEAWLEKVRQEATEHKAQRHALLQELQDWTHQHVAGQGEPDWKAVSRALHQFAERWRNGGHVSEKIFAELQPLWKQVWGAASAPLDAAQQASLQRRQAMIDEAASLGAAPVLRLDAVKALQQRWQAEAQSVPLERRQEQKLWDAFRKPIDEAFARKSESRERQQSQMSDRDRAVLEASKALQAANASGNAQQIRAAMQALDAAMQATAVAAPPAPEPIAQAPEVAPAAVAPETAAEAAPESASESNDGSEDTIQEPAPEPVAQQEAPAAPQAKPARPVVAVRGDDRPGLRQSTKPELATGRAGGGRERRDGRSPGRDARGADARRDMGRDMGRDFAGRDAATQRGPRLGDAAFRAQRDATEAAQAALRKLSAQAHGEALGQLMGAWKSRDAAQLPNAQELGGRVTAAVRSSWAQAVTAAAAGATGAEALLRLEMAAEVPTPAHQLDARRALQLQLLTKRNDPQPQQTWAQDAATVLRAANDPESERRLQQALKVLLRK